MYRLKKMPLLKVTIEVSSSVPHSGRAQIEAEAVTLAPFKGGTAVEVAFTEAP
jgi:hypothetical protein